VNGKTYFNGLGNDEVVVGSAVDGGAAVDVVAAATVGCGNVVCGDTEAAAQPAVTAQTTIRLHRRDIVVQPLTRDLRLTFMRSLACAVIVIAALATGCKVSEGSRSAETLPPLGTPSNTKPATTLTTVVAATDQVATSTIALPGGACVFAPPPATSEVTFEVGTRLYTVNPASGTSSCLTELTSDSVGPLRWSPAGDRVLLNSATVFDGTQALVTGYFSTNTRVSWSYPTGKALIAPAVADDHLLWRAAGRPETRTDISFLERTDVAAYHPAGRHILAGGQAGDGTSGLFLAGNRGENPRLISRLEGAARVTEIGPDPSGKRVYFIHDHANGTFHVHAVELSTLAVTDIAMLPEPIAKLTLNTIADAPIAYRLGDCGGITRTQVAQGAVVAEQPAAFAALATEPVGWVDAQQLVLSVRPSGCGGPSDLWIWNVATSAATPLINGVEHAAIRSVLTSFGELPGGAGGDAPE